MPNNETSNCTICFAKKFSRVDSVHLGYFKEEAQKKLSRYKLTVDIGKCLYCGHIQVTTPMTPSEVSHMYNSPAPQDSSDNMEQFLNMVDPSYHESSFKFCQPEILADGKVIADIGCNLGKGLAALHKYYKIKKKNLIGIDFFDPKMPKDFRFINADLNRITNETPFISDRNTVIDFALVESVLEHVLNPRLFLQTIHQTLSSEGHLFIDVPDATTMDLPTSPGDVTLIHPHHLQYFSKETLIYLANTSGFDVVRIISKTGPDFPRLNALLQKRKTNTQESAINASLNIIEERLQKTIATILKIAKETSCIYLWGAGYDLVEMLDKSDALKKLMVQPDKIKLYNNTFVGKTYLGIKIHDSADLANHINESSRVILTPIGIDTRKSMMNCAISWGIQKNILDPYLP